MELDNQKTKVNKLTNKAIKWTKHFIRILLFKIISNNLFHLFEWQNYAENDKVLLIFLEHSARQICTLQTRHVNTMIQYVNTICRKNVTLIIQTSLWLGKCSYEIFNVFVLTDACLKFLDQLKSSVAAYRARVASPIKTTRREKD